MTKLEKEIEEIYLSWMRKYNYLKPTHFIISEKTYIQLRKEFNSTSFYLQQKLNNNLIKETTIRGLPFIIHNEKEDHYIAIALILES